METKKQRKTRIEIGQLRAWKQGVWEGKTFTVIESFVTQGDNYKNFHILQSGQIITVYESALRNLSEVIEDL